MDWIFLKEFALIFDPKIARINDYLGVIKIGSHDWSR